MKKIIFFVMFSMLFGCKKVKKVSHKTNPNSIDYYTDFVNLDGSSFDISTLKEKKVLINFWATWCGPCIKEMPDLLVAQKVLVKENYVFLLVSDESIEDIVEFKKIKNYNFKFLKSNKSIDSYGVYALPTTFVFNEKGIKSDKIVGAVEWDSEEMITQLKNIQ